MEHIGELQGLTLFLLLHAFANGTTALTGVEAISNGVTAFKEPRRRNAGVTLLWMALILATLFLGISFLAWPIGALPSEKETVISQIARTAFDGRGLLYLATIGATTLILIMAANTAYAGFPRLSALQAEDGLPYRLLLEPLLDYVKDVADRRQPNETLTIVVPQFVPRRWWHQLLHAQTAVILRLALINRPGIVITSVPYQMDVGDGDAPATGGNG